MTVRELFSDPSKWTQGWNAKNSDGLVTNIRDEDACCWCLSGAIIKCYPDNWPEITREVHGKLVDRDCCSSMVIFNDHPGRTFEEIISLVEECSI